MTNRIIDIEGNKQKIIDLLNIKRAGIKELVEFLKESTYFTDPASSKFHNNTEGGLADHGLNVLQVLKEKNKRYNLGLTNQEMVISALCHDLCKIGFYKKGTRNEKISTYDKLFKKYKDTWVKKECWQVNDESPLGHGEKSVIILQQFIKLTENEIYMIRFHMGMSLKEDELKNYYKATSLYPCVVAMHTSDYEASQYMENIYEDKIIE